MRRPDPPHHQEERWNHNKEKGEISAYFRGIIRKKDGATKGGRSHTLGGEQDTRHKFLKKDSKPIQRRGENLSGC